MAIHPTGSDHDELVYITTDKLSVTIKGSAYSPRIGVTTSSDQLSDLKVSCNDHFQLELTNKAQVDTNVTQIANGMFRGSFPTSPLFYEHQNYEIVMESNAKYVVEFWHDNINIRNKVGPVGRSGKMLSGVINFGNEIGFSNLLIKLNGIPYLRIILEIFPSKLKYKEDYQQLMADVTDEVYNLAFEFLRKTYLEARINEKAGNSPTEFFSIIRLIFDKFINAADIIVNKPHHTLATVSEILPAHKIKQVQNQTLRWLERHPEYVRPHLTGYAAEKALTTKKRVTYDTVENQFAKFILESTAKKLMNLRAHYLRLHRDKDDEMINMIDRMINGIMRRKNQTFFREVSRFNSTASVSLVFTMAPGYKELFKYYLMMQHGLSLDGDLFHISVKDLALLYEYWCFIKLNSIMKNRYRLIKQDIIKVDGRGLFVSLRKGAASKVTYENPDTGEQIELSYNPKSQKLPTVAQKPDNVLSLQKHGSKTKYQYIFDAKYRINPALEGTGYRAIYTTPGPEEDDINTMHRYRDALVHEHSLRPDFERSMFGAYVLFPYGNEVEYSQHKFYQSIDQVNIGGLPFLPSATSMVANLLDELVADSPESAFERATLPVGITEKLVDNDLSVRDVMVGVVRSKEQLKANIAYKFYHIPVRRIADNRFPIHYIALYQSDNIFGHDSGIRLYGSVLRCSTVKRKDITEIPTKSKQDEWYYRFDVQEWTELNCPIKVREFGPRVNIFTNKFLLENSEYVPELYIRSTEELRLYTELKRLASVVKIDGDQDKVEGFEFNNSIIRLANGEIAVHTSDGRYHSYSLKSFKNKPRSLFNEIRGMVTGIC
ncbi:Domain of unknown function DUF2357-containing protein [Syntrophobotulus glycolicus DSM 8271]|uniref:DUF2357 domain-containing protein n=1 Tax=Syntrophobotulus glycolicus (strain DSM 8271 / FlGlyR) TaxID=645991 RepID=F0STV1_SYNGF|nr:restriction endonuclease-like protein [Syntrophobotulus glycolicus]ADY55391.1 Domain of unknown function DUF2357-containing protein [Syntrophobotulus glycolicus DSM 8271]